MNAQFRTRCASSLLLCLATGCTDAFTARPAGLVESAATEGPKVVFDLDARPLPEIPFPNDLATRPDPESPTGRRLNLSLLGPTLLESEVRAKADALDGFGTFAPITVSFDAAIDAPALRALHLDRDPTNDGVYLVDVDPQSPDFGTLVPVDLGYYAELPDALRPNDTYASPKTGRFASALDEPNNYFPFDPRAGTSTLLFETFTETDSNGDGVLDPAEDTDNDGVLDRPNTADGASRPTGSLEEADALVPFFEYQTNTLIFRPVRPLREGTTYGVVLTRRIVDLDGRPIGSPFVWVNHTRQTEVLQPVVPALETAETSLDDVAFAWAFSTQSATRELLAIRDGINARGPLAWLAERFPPEFELFPWWTDESVANCLRTQPEAACVQRFDDPGVLDAQKLVGILRLVAPLVLGDGPDVQALLDTYKYVDYLIAGRFKSPNFLIDRDNLSAEGYPQDDDESFDLDLDGPDAGRAVVGDGWVTFWCTVPKTLDYTGLDGRPAKHTPPFPVVFYGHGYGGARMEMLGFAGHHARFGLATCGIDAYGHGIVIPPEYDTIVNNVLTVALGNAGIDGKRAIAAVTAGRARDLNNDGVPDSGGDFWTADTFHTRDMVRQSAVDQLQLVRLLKGFDGKNGVQSGDFDGDGKLDVAGAGGEFFSWGQSLGGILSVLAPVVERSFVAAAPVAGGAGLVDIGIRSANPGVPEAVVLRMMGPMVLGEPVFTEGDAPLPTPRFRLSWLVPDTSPPATIPDVTQVAVGEFEFEEGDVIVARNLTREGKTYLGPSERRIAVVRLGQGFRLQYAADAWSASEKRARLGFDPRAADFEPYRMSEAEVVASGDRFVFEVYSDGDFKGIPLTAAAAERLDARPAPKPRFTIDAWQADTTFQGTIYPAEAPLVAPSVGLGHPRQTPDLRRFFGIAQAILDAGDPAAYARRYFVDPLDLAYQGIEGRNETRAIVVPTTGDQNVPINTGVALARAMGVVDFETPRDDLEGLTEDDFLLATGVYEGTRTYPRWVDERGVYNFDPDDLDNGTDGLATDPKGNFKLRLLKRTPGGGYAGLRMPYTARNAHDREGGNFDTHGFDASSPSFAFDINTFMAQQLSFFFMMRGQGFEPAQLDDPCLAALGDDEESCAFAPPFPQ